MGRQDAGGQSQLDTPTTTLVRRPRPTAKHSPPSAPAGVIPVRCVRTERRHAGGVFRTRPAARLSPPSAPAFIMPARCARTARRHAGGLGGMTKTVRCLWRLRPLAKHSQPSAPPGSIPARCARTERQHAGGWTTTVRRPRPPAKHSPPSAPAGNIPARCARMERRHAGEITIWRPRPPARHSRRGRCAEARAGRGAPSASRLGGFGFNALGEKERICPRTKPRLRAAHPQPSLLPSREKGFAGWDSGLVSAKAGVRNSLDSRFRGNDGGIMSGNSRLGLSPHRHLAIVPIQLRRILPP